MRYYTTLYKCLAEPQPGACWMGWHIGHIREEFVRMSEDYLMDKGKLYHDNDNDPSPFEDRLINIIRITDKL